MDVKLGTAAGGVKGTLALKSDSLAWEAKEGGHKVDMASFNGVPVRAEGSWFKVQGSRFMLLWFHGFMVSASGFRLQVFRLQAPGFMV